MKIGEFIVALQGLQEKAGDVDVTLRIREGAVLQGKEIKDITLDIGLNEVKEVRIVG